MDSPESHLPAWYEAFSPLMEGEPYNVILKQPVQLSSGEIIRDVPACFLRFDRWAGERFIDDFRKGESAMIDLNGEHLFAEIALLRLLGQKRWDGRWVCPYGFGARTMFFTEWADKGRDDQQHVPIPQTEREPRELLASIVRRNRMKHDGCWDVFAWKDGQYVFAEAKKHSRSLKDELNPNQLRWLREALELNKKCLPLSSFVIVQWDYKPDRMDVPTGDRSEV